MAALVSRITVALLILVAHHVFAQSPEWTLMADTVDPEEYYGITMANGVVGLVSSPEPLKVDQVVLNGVYDEYKRGRVSNILETFSHMNLGLEVDGGHLKDPSIQNFRQWLDMKTATFHSTFSYQGRLEVQHQLMSLRNLPYSAMAIVELHAKEDVAIQVSNDIKVPSHLNSIRNFYTQIDRPHTLIPLLSSVAGSPGGAELAVSNSFIFEEEKPQQPQIVHEEWDSDKHTMKFQLMMKAGESYRFALVGSTLSSVHYDAPRNEAERLTIYGRLEGIDRLVEQHRKAWKELWRGDIEIKGDLRSQLAVRSALYHLYSFARAGSGYSMSPMGLSGLGYNGHVFWDTELWMLPNLILLQPEIAKSILEYRFQRLNEAKKNAFAHGYDGAMFPWESAASGNEETPVWALTGPFQQHISATIGWAFWKYFQATQDKEWLKERGFPVLKEVATFWLSRVEHDPDGTCHIRNVIGANEWEENIDDNAFTNGMVKTVLEATAKAAKLTRNPLDPNWEDVANRLVILRFPNGVTRENATYEGQMIKQADANLLSFPLRVISEPENIRKDLLYYENLISPKGPAMGLSIISTLWTKLGEPEKGFQKFEASYQPLELPPFGVLAETSGGTNPYFATGAGGMLQSVLFGFGGVEITDKGVVRDKVSLPSQWSSLTISR